MKGTDAFDKTEHGANLWVPGATMPDFLPPPDAVLLPCKGKSGKRACPKIRDGACERGNGTGTHPHGKVAKTKKVVENRIWTTEVFARSEEVEIADDQGVGFRRSQRGVLEATSQGDNVNQQSHGQGLDHPRRRWVDCRP